MRAATRHRKATRKSFEFCRHQTTIIEGVTRVIFDRAELAAKTVAPKRKAVVTFPDYGSSFLLDARDPRSGPVTEKWSLADM
jgi:hypothetical protein